MAKTTSKKQTRLNITTQTMRELMFASGGRCAMTDCGLSLVSPSGGWIGTVAHIIAAEPTGPRGSGPATPKERASFANLLLMCATHGREVDAPQTGEQNFPIDMLRTMKKKHEAKVSEAITAAIEQELSGVQTATGAIDTTLRSATEAETAEGLVESLGLDAEPAVVDAFVRALSEARAQLRRLSQPALDTLSQLLALWVLECSDVSGKYRDFGDPSGLRPAVPVDHVRNRVMRGNSSTVQNGMSELETQGLLSTWTDEDAGTADYCIDATWLSQSRHRYSFWPSIAGFLWDGHGVDVADWVKGLDFSIFDRPAPAGRNVPWR